MVDFIDVITIEVRQNAAPTVRNSSGLPIVLPGMPSISIRGIVTGPWPCREREREREHRRGDIPTARLTTPARLYPGLVNGTGYYFRRETTPSRAINLVT